MAFEAEGVLHKVFDEEQKSDSFKAREFVVETEEKYPQFVKFQLVQDKCNLIDGHNEGDKVKVTFDLRGREWKGKYFTNLQAWKVESSDGSVAGSSASSGGTSSASTSARQADSSQAGSSASTAAATPQVDFDDDIPF